MCSARYGTVVASDPDAGSCCRNALFRLLVDDDAIELRVDGCAGVVSCSVHGVDRPCSPAHGALLLSLGNAIDAPRLQLPWPACGGGVAGPAFYDDDDGYYEEVTLCRVEEVVAP